MDGAKDDDLGLRFPTLAIERNRKDGARRVLAVRHWLPGGLNYRHEQADWCASGDGGRGFERC